MRASLVFASSAYAVNGYAAQAIASVAASRAPPRRRPTSRSPRKDEQVEPDRRRVRRRQLVPAPAPAECEHRGHVRQVRHRAVRVAARVGRLAASVRLDPLPDLTLRVRRAARRAVGLDGHVAVRRLTVEDPVGADHACIADVDHGMRGLDVQANPQADEKDRRRRRAARRATRVGRAGGGRRLNPIQAVRTSR